MKAEKYSIGLKMEVLMKKTIQSVKSL